MKNKFKVEVSAALVAFTEEYRRRFVELAEENFKAVTAPLRSRGAIGLYGMRSYSHLEAAEAQTIAMRRIQARKEDARRVYSRGKGKYLQTAAAMAANAYNEALDDLEVRFYSRVGEIDPNGLNVVAEPTNTGATVTIATGEEIITVIASYGSPFSNSPKCSFTIKNIEE